MSNLRLSSIMWLCAALFLIFGLPLFVVEDEDWRKYLLGLCAMSLGGFALSMAGDGCQKGEIKFNLSLISRRDQPVAFWSAVTIVTVAGVVTFGAGIWAIFFKTW